MVSPARSAATDTDDERREGSFDPSQDPLNPRKVAMDIFEAYCHDVLMTSSVERRSYLMNETKYMVERLIGKQYDHGRLYNRTIIANVVGRICGRHAYADPDEVPQDDDQTPSDCLIDFTPTKWKKSIDQFESLRESLIQNDASMIILPSKVDENGEEDLPEGDGGINEAHESHPDFSKEYDKMLDRMKFHMCLSHVRPQLETAIQKDSMESADSVVIPHDDIVAFDSAIRYAEFVDSKYANILYDLLNKQNNQSIRHSYVGLHLKSFGEIKQTFALYSRKFDLELFQHRFIQLIRRWSDLVLPVPELSSLGYGCTNASADVNRKPMVTLDDKENMPGSGTGTAKKSRRRQKSKDRRKPPPDDNDPSFENAADDDIVDSSSEEERGEKMGASNNLKRKTKALMKKVKDPLDECVAIAQSARPLKNAEDSGSEDDSTDDDEKAVKTPSFRKKKKSTRLSFTDSESDDSEEEGVTLSEVPTRYKPKKHANSPMQITVSHKCSARKKRKRFTEVEDGAIRNGVEEFGVGRWTEIKAMHAMELRDRTCVQMKDRWRTLTK